MRPAPTSLAARLFLLSYDIDHDRFICSSELGLLIRAGALTDLFLAGYLIDDNGRAKVDNRNPAHAHAHARNRGHVSGPGTGSAHDRGLGQANDPVLADLLRQIADSRPRKWKHWVNKGARGTKRAVRDQLAADGWVRVERRRVLGIVPADRVVVRERTAVVQLQREAGRVLRGTTPMSRVEPADAALVALAATGELRTFAGRRDRRANKRRISEATVATGPVAAALRSALRDSQASTAVAV